MTNYDALARNMKPEHLWPPSRDNEYYFHRGSWWNNFPLLQNIFDGQLTEIRSTVKASQFLQYEGLKYAVEANRRRAMTCSGTFPWQFNEPYPNNTCTSSVDYYAAPKPAYYGVRAAYAPDTVTAKFSSQTLAGDSCFHAEVFWQSSQAGRMPYRISASVLQQDGNVCVTEEFETKRKKQEPEKAVRVGEIRCLSERITCEIFYMCLNAFDRNGKILAENRYCFTKTTMAPLLLLPNAKIRTKAVVQDDKCYLNIINTGNVVASGVWLEDVRDTEKDIIVSW